MAGEREKLKATGQKMAPKEIMTEIARRWKALEANEKKPWNDEATRRKEEATTATSTATAMAPAPAGQVVQQPAAQPPLAEAGCSDVHAVTGPEEPKKKKKKKKPRADA